MVAESDLEAETAQPVASNVQEPDEYSSIPDEYLSKPEEHLRKPEVFIDNAATGSAGGHDTFRNSYSSVKMRKDKVDESDNINIEIIYSETLIVQSAMKPSSIVTAENSGITNFKRFRKVLLLVSEYFFSAPFVFNWCANYRLILNKSKPNPLIMP